MFERTRGTVSLEMFIVNILSYQMVATKINLMKHAHY